MCFSGRSHVKDSLGSTSREEEEEIELRTDLTGDFVDLM